MFLSNLKVGLINIYQSLLEGSHFATAGWASPEKVPFIFVPMNTVLKETTIHPLCRERLDHLASPMKIFLRILF
jgi:hypothetical protein